MQANPTATKKDIFMSRSLRRSVFMRSVKLIPRTVLERLTETLFVPLIYHVVSDERLPHVDHIYRYRNSDAFSDDLDYFLRRYRVLSLQDIIDTINNNRPIEEPSFLVTFDDGMREFIEVAAPILNQKGVPATVFITTDFLDNKKLFYRHKQNLILNRLKTNNNKKVIKELESIFLKIGQYKGSFEKSIMSIDYQYVHILDEIAQLVGLDIDEFLQLNKPYMSTEQVRKILGNGFTIGAHSRDHPPYISISHEEQVYQTLSSIDELHKIFSIDYSTFAFPFTHRGVLAGLYETILANGVDVMFGSVWRATPGEDSDNGLFKRCINRVSLESSCDSASQQLYKLQTDKLRSSIGGLGHKLINGIPKSGAM